MDTRTGEIVEFPEGGNPDPKRFTDLSLGRIDEIAGWPCELIGVDHDGQKLTLCPISLDKKTERERTTSQSLYLNIKLQEGPIGEDGINGCQIDDVVQYCVDRIDEFNNKEDGKFACKENCQAIEHLESALGWLKKRTANREARGVEGTNRA